MNAKLKIVSFVTMACLLASSLFWTKPFGIQSASAATMTAQFGGFLYPWDDDPNISTDNKLISQNTVDGEHDNHSGQEVDFKQGTPGQNFDILAPKDGVVIYASDSSPDNWHGDCPQYAPATNYIVLGHGYTSLGVFAFYTVYYHLKHDSIPNEITEGSYIRLGQKIGIVGTTGWSTGNHLHFMGTDKPVKLVTNPVKDCNGNTLATARTWVTVNSSDTRSIGFEEAGNQWPLLNGKKGSLENSNNPASYNWTGIQQNDCNPLLDSAKVVLYNHVDYGGECIPVASPENGANVPSQLHISSIYLNPSWLQLQNGYRTLTLWDGYNQSGNQIVIGNSQPRLNNLRSENWNDRVKSVHNAFHSNAPWLLEESYAFQAPFNVNIHIRVANDPDFNAWRVCFDGQNCQENAAPINELYYTWNTYGWADGNHIISVQYRRTSDNGNWANADYYETNFYLNPNRQTYAPCGTNVNGARLVSGSDCIIVTTNVADMAPVGWADRSNLSIIAQGYDVLAYDSSDFQGAPRLIRSGQTASVGGNVSGIELRQSLPASYIPTEPLGADTSTIVYLPMDEGSGTQIYSQVGALTGNLVGSASFTTGLFGSAVSAPSTQSGTGINFGAVDFGSPLTVELLVKFNSANDDQRIATQLGGGGNTGYNKWLIGLVGGRFRVWSCYTNGCHEGYSLESVQTGRWYYLMFTYDGAATAKFYVDSVLQTTLAMDGAMSGGSTTFELGKGENIYGCHCTIDDLRISNIVRVPLGPPAPTLTPMPTSTPIDIPTPAVTDTPIPTSTATSGPRTISVPQEYSTISQAMDVAQAGETILVAEGTYNEKFSVKSGVKVIGAGAATTTIRGDGVGVVVYVGGSAELSGFTITNSGTDNWDAGVWVDNASGVISKNIITGNNKGIVLYCFSPCTTEPRISNNLIYGNSSVGLFVHDGLVRIINNTITDNFSGISVDRAGTTLLNNNVTGNSFEGINGNSVSLTLDYNNFWNNGQNYSGTTPGANDISVDPLYVSLSANDYHINSYSSLIDRGTVVQGIADDIDNQIRPFDGNGDGNSAFDIGADEYVGLVAPTQTPTHTATASNTPTNTRTATPTSTPMPGPLNTGLLNPSSNAAQTGGDSNGYEVNTTYAYANDGLFAVDNNSGNNTNTSCANSGKDKHRFHNYGFSLPGTAVIQGIEVRLDAKVDSTSGSPKLCVQLSWDGGMTWTTAKSTSTLSTAEQTFMLGGSTDTWGRAWTTSQLSNANFRVRIIQVASSTSRDFSLDWIAVRVTYR